MKTTRAETLVFRAALAAAVIIITHVATTDHSYPVVEDLNDKLNHALAFFGLALLADFAFPRARFDVRKILALLGYGLLIELIQYWLPHRDASLLDLLADATGITAYLLAAPLVRRLPLLRRRWRNDGQNPPARSAAEPADRS